MLILTRKKGQSLLIDGQVEVVVVGVRGDQVRLGVVAPRGVSVMRKELLDQVRGENVAAAAAAKDVSNRHD